MTRLPREKVSLVPTRLVPLMVSGKYGAGSGEEAVGGVCRRDLEHRVGPAPDRQACGAVRGAAPGAMFDVESGSPGATDHKQEDMR